MRVLFVLYHFPPMTTVAATRASRMLQGLVRHGVEPVVLTPGVGEDRSLESVGGASVDVVRFVGADPLAALHRNRMGGGESRQSRLRRRGNTLARSLWLPDERRSLIKPWIAAGKKLAGKPFACVYSSASPATAGFVGKALAESLGKPWVMELRDLWAKNPYSPQTSQPLSSWFINRWERDHLFKAAKIVVLTQAHRKHLQALYSGLGGKICVAPSMFQPLTTKPGLRSTQVMRIFYGGTLYGDRTLVPLGRAIDTLKRVGPFSRIQLEVAGRSYSASWKEVLGGDGENRMLHGILPQERVQELLHQVHAGVLNNPAHDAIHVPGKFYDYLAAGLPVIDLSSQPEIQSLARGVMPVWQVPGGNLKDLHRALQELAQWWAKHPRGMPLPTADHPLSLERVTGDLAETLRSL